ncbi:hypothetical protein FGO68_gene12190 [Halteria grandinella]|uniref:Uncharacterized protein n=1 Tax=Halteria grandinella TaxID=5974 RepID=A0A8J8NH44_HALGN|nr:hypothetical protein FGO68_gene12190 [Halteria grandinella]
MRETIQMPKLVPHPPLDTHKRYASVQNRGYGQQKLINNRMMLLNAISRIDELSQSHGGGTIGPSLDTERSNDWDEQQGKFGQETVRPKGSGQGVIQHKSNQQT